MRNPPASINCGVCGVHFSVPHTRRNTAKYCSRKCSDSAPRKHHEIRCRECGSLFQRKKSACDKNAIWGNFCSSTCVSRFRSRANTGSGNPNFKGRNFDHDGYRIFAPHASLNLGLGKIKEHHAVALLAVGLRKIPKGLHVHHRDCDQLNNSEHNLAFLTASDHKWLHHQYGTATLRAIMEGRIPVEEACLWSDDPARACGILFSNVTTQSILFKYAAEKHGVTDIGLICAARPVRVNFVEVDELSETARGAGGFGSTGNGGAP